jgi:hypothetical protein
MVLLRLDKAAEAEAELRIALAIDQRLADENPAVARFARNLAFFQLALGDLLTETDRESQGVAEYRAARAILRRLSDEDPGVTDYRGLLWSAHRSLGRALWYTGRLVLYRSDPPDPLRHVSGFPGLGLLWGLRRPGARAR